MHKSLAARWVVGSFLLSLLPGLSPAAAPRRRSKAGRGPFASSSGTSSSRSRSRRTTTSSATPSPTYLKTRPGFAVRSVKLDDPEQGLTDQVLDGCDVLVWWGHVRNREVSPETGKRIVERIKAGKLSLVALHSAHWSAPFVQAMCERTTQDALKDVPEAERANVKVRLRVPRSWTPCPKRDDPLTPSVSRKRPGGGDELVIKLPDCVFPAFRADGKPSHVTTLLPGHPIAAGIPKQWDVPQTEMYDEPFHVPEPDEVVFEEKWDKGE